MNDKILLLIIIIVAAIISSYLFFTRFSIEQNEDYFHSKMLLSVKDLPQGYYINYFGAVTRYKNINATQAKGYHVEFSSNSFGKPATFIYDSSITISGYDKDWIGKTMLSAWNSAGVYKGKNWTFVKADVPEELKSIGDYNLFLVGNSSFQGINFSDIQFSFTKGQVYQFLSIAGPSESVSVNDLVKLSSILDNLTK